MAYWLESRKIHQRTFGRIVIFALSPSGLFHPLTARAKIMNSTTTLQLMQNYAYDFGSMLAQNIPKMLLIVSALIGLIWGIKKFLKYVTSGGGKDWLPYGNLRRGRHIREYNKAFNKRLKQYL